MKPREFNVSETLKLDALKEKIKDSGLPDDEQRNLIFTANAMACAKVNCAASVPDTDPNYAILKKLQDAGKVLNEADIQGKNFEALMAANGQAVEGEEFEYGALDKLSDALKKKQAPEKAKTAVKLAVDFGGTMVAGSLEMAGTSNIKDVQEMHGHINNDIEEIASTPKSTEGQKVLDTFSQTETVDKKSLTADSNHFVETVFPKASKNLEVLKDTDASNTETNEAQEKLVQNVMEEITNVYKYVKANTDPNLTSSNVNSTQKGNIGENILLTGEKTFFVLSDVENVDVGSIQNASNHGVDNIVRFPKVLTVQTEAKSTTGDQAGGIGGKAKYPAKHIEDTANKALGAKGVWADKNVSQEDKDMAEKVLEDIDDDIPFIRHKAEIFLDTPLEPKDITTKPYPNKQKPEVIED